MDLCEQGAADYGLAFGGTAGYLQAPRLIATREGVGAELALGARALGADPFREALAEYCRLRGWDAEGIPTRDALDRLSLSELSPGDAV
jgi:aldehyde:ferredoxin oxidoreductase